jgi:hypothetical protein
VSCGIIWNVNGVAKERIATQREQPVLTVQLASTTDSVAMCVASAKMEDSLTRTGPRNVNDVKNDRNATQRESLH